MLAIGSQSGKGQSGIGQSRSIGQSGKMPIGRRSQSEFSANRVLHQAPTAWAHYGPIGQFSASTANRPIGRTAEGIRKLNMMMRIQSGSLCQSGNRAFTANRPIRQFFPIGKSGICVGMGSNRAIGCFLRIGQPGFYNHSDNCF